MDNILFIIIVLIIIIALSIIIYCNRNNIATFFFKKENYEQSSNKKKVKFNTNVKMFKYVPRNVNTIPMSDDASSNKTNASDSITSTSVNNTASNRESDAPTPTPTSASSTSTPTSISTSISTPTDISDYDDFTDDEISDVDGNQILFDPANSSYEELLSEVSSPNRTHEENRWDNNFKDKLVSDKDRQAYIKKLARENNNYVRSLKQFTDKKDDVITVKKKCIRDSKTFDDPKFKRCTIGQIYDKFTQNKIIISKKPKAHTHIHTHTQKPIIGIEDDVDYDKLYLNANFGNGF